MNPSNKIQIHPKFWPWGPTESNLIQNRVRFLVEFELGPFLMAARPYSTRFSTLRPRPNLNQQLQSGWVSPQVGLGFVHTYVKVIAYWYKVDIINKRSIFSLQDSSICDINLFQCFQTYILFLKRSQFLLDILPIILYSPLISIEAKWN